jgi:hypothetical protein
MLSKKHKNTSQNKKYKKNTKIRLKNPLGNSTVVSSTIPKANPSIFLFPSMLLWKMWRCLPTSQ